MSLAKKRKGKGKAKATAPTKKRTRLNREKREQQIVEEAVCYFAEVGFGGQTRELARRLGISQSLLFRYFPSKDTIVERVYEEVYIRRWKPEWEVMLTDRSISLDDRLTDFYLDYTHTIFEYEWVRMLIFSGIKGVTSYQKYLGLIKNRILKRICIELRATYKLPDADKNQVTQRELDLAWSLHGGVFYIAIRKYIYGVEKRDNFDQAIRDNIKSFLNGAPKTLKSILN